MFFYCDFVGRGGIFHVHLVIILESGGLMLLFQRRRGVLRSMMPAFIYPIHILCVCVLSIILFYL